MIKHTLHVLNAVRYAASGFLVTIKEEPPFRVELALISIFVPLALYIDRAPTEKAILIFSMMLVLIIELVNSSIERIVDRISLKHHILSKHAKDIGSCAVFFSILNAIGMWGIIVVWPYLMQCL